MGPVIVSTRATSGWPEFAGSTWVRLQYVLGFQRLGAPTFWVDHLGPGDPHNPRPHSLEYLVARFDGTAREFGFQDRYCIEYNGGERYFGMTEKQFRRLVSEAELLVSVSGGLPSQSPLMRIRRRAYIDVDPGFTQIWARDHEMTFGRHTHFFTVGQNVGRPEFTIPTCGIDWHPILPPVVLEFWPPYIAASCERFSTIADWRSSQCAVFEGEYYGTKREEFLRFLRVPREVKQRVEIALCIHPSEYEDLRTLVEHGWELCDPYLWAGDPLSYREYIRSSRAEFGVAKGGYVKSNSGWVSDRTACYLASGKPALVQSTGFEGRLPAGKGLLTFRTPEEAVAGVGAINNDYLAHCAAARELAERCFDSDVVLGSVLERVGL